MCYTRCNVNIERQILGLKYHKHVALLPLFRWHGVKLKKKISFSLISETLF